MDIKETVLKYLGILLPIPRVSGHESYFSKEIKEKLSPFFSNIEIDRVGNVKIKKGDAANGRILIDAHIDQIGFIVREAYGDGFVSLCPIGGIDPRTLASSDLVIHSKEKIPAVIFSVPPHLRTGEEKLRDASEALADTGRTDITDCVRPGDAVTYKSDITYLKNGCISALSLDNTVCAACALAALELFSPECEICTLLSVREETGAFAGLQSALYTEMPDRALVLDVNFAKAEDVSECESVELGGGFSVSLSALTDKEYTEKIIKFAKEKGLKVQEITEADNLGTNGNIASVIGEGRKIANISIPQKNMHSPSEIVSLDDTEQLVLLLKDIGGVR